jgi:hypothetical protein
MGSAIVRRENLRAALKVRSSEMYAAEIQRRMHHGPRAEEWDAVGLDRISMDPGLIPDWTGREQEYAGRFWDLMARMEPQTFASWVALSPLKIMGLNVRASERAFATYSNELRTGVYEQMIKPLPSARTDKGFATRQAIANFLNITGGRSTSVVGKALSGPFMTGLFWAARLQGSRMEAVLHQLPKGILGPTTGWAVRKEALRQVLGAAALTLGTYAAIKMLVESTEEAEKEKVSVDFDPRSSDFLKIRIGNKRIDLTGGHQNALRIVFQSILGMRKNTVTGKLQRVDRVGNIGMWLRYKFGPLASEAATALEDKTAVQEIETVPRHLRDMFVPISFRQLREVYDADGIKGLGWLIPETLGASFQMYDNNVERQIDDLQIFVRKLRDPNWSDPARLLYRKLKPEMDKEQKKEWDEELEKRYDSQVTAYRKKWYDELFAAYADGDKSGMDEAAKALTRLGVTRKEVRQSAQGRKIVRKGEKLPSDIRHKFLLRRHSKAIPSNVKEFSTQYP